MCSQSFYRTLTEITGGPKSRCICISNALKYNWRPKGPVKNIIGPSPCEPELKYQPHNPNPLYSHTIKSLTRRSRQTLRRKAAQRERERGKMVSLKLQKRLSASVLKCGKGKVWLDPNEVNEISMANSRKTLLPYCCPFCSQVLVRRPDWVVTIYK